VTQAETFDATSYSRTHDSPVKHIAGELFQCVISAT